MTDAAVSPPIHEALGPDISAHALHAVLALRSNVFIVEQECVYNDIDGLDLLPTTRHLWMVDGEDAIATVRILSSDTDPLTETTAPTQIGRVATHAEHRGKGLAAQLMQRALTIIGGPSKLSAQAYLEEWYGGFGFVTVGEGYLEDGIPHIPMERS